MTTENSVKDNLYQFHINDSEYNKIKLHFKDNKIDTTKYNIFSFIPKALILQFVRLANVYFLVSAILQSIPIISPLTPLTAVVPFVLVLSVSIAREGIEDCNRANLDNQQNNEPSSAYVNGNWESTTSGKLEMGQIVEVLQEQPFPADLILIDSELPEGICFIETGTLDGEKTLKQKESPTETKGKFNIKVLAASASLFFNNIIASFVKGFFLFLSLLSSEECDELLDEEESLSLFFWDFFCLFDFLLSFELNDSFLVFFEGELVFSFFDLLCSVVRSILSEISSSASSSIPSTLDLI